MRFLDPAAVLGPPFKSNDPRLDELVELVLSLDPRSTQLPDGPAPQELPPKVSTQTPSGSAAASVVILGHDHSPSDFMRQAGFEVSLDFTTTHTAASMCEFLAAMVARKDVAANGVLLITVGGPDQNGLIHPGEEAMAELFLETAVGLNLQPSHLDRVVLHRWALGDAWDLYPIHRRVVAPSGGAALLKPKGGAIELEYPVVIPSALFGQRNDPCACGSGRKAKFCHLAYL